MSKNAVLVLILVITALFSVSLAFYKTVVKQDFQVTNIEPEPSSEVGE